MSINLYLYLYRTEVQTRYTTTLGSRSKLSMQTTKFHSSSEWSSLEHTPFHMARPATLSAMVAPSFYTAGLDSVIPGSADPVDQRSVFRQPSSLSQLDRSEFWIGEDRTIHSGNLLRDGPLHVLLRRIVRWFLDRQIRCGAAIRESTVHRTGRERPLLGQCGRESTARKWRHHGHCHWPRPVSPVQQGLSFNTVYTHAHTHTHTRTTHLLFESQKQVS